MSIPNGFHSAPRTRARILLVDDDPLITDLVVDMLDLEGHDVDTAGDGMEALSKLETQRYDLIVSDLHMPKMNGALFYRELERRRAHPLNRIIFLTGTTGTSEEHREVRASGAPVLLKPFNVVELVDLVRNMLSRE